MRHNEEHAKNISISACLWLCLIRSQSIFFWNVSSLIEYLAQGHNAARQWLWRSPLSSQANTWNRHTEPPPQPPRSSQHISLSRKYNTLTYSRDRVSRGTMIKSTKYAISVRQKQKDSLASSKSLFDKGGATQRTRKSIYATAITARFFFWRWDLLWSTAWTVNHQVW